MKYTKEKQITIKQIKMKKNIFITLTLFGILCSSCNLKKEHETREIEKFDKVNLVGSIELHLEENASNSIKVMAKNASNIEDLITEVRDGELYIYSESSSNVSIGTKYTIYLGHSGISDLTLTGVITLISDDVINQKNLVIEGAGVLNGNIEVLVENLSVDLNGTSNVSISGNADVAHLKISGIGMINAKNLETNNLKEDSDGIATIWLPSN